MSTDESQQGRSWNAGVYDTSFSFIWEHGSSLVDLLDPDSGDRILDLGCGTGHLTRQMADSGAQVIGIDNSPDMIAQARQNYPDIHFEVADATDFQVGSPIDAIFSNAVLHWVRQPEKVAVCAASALKPGGRFVVELGGKGNIQGIVDAIYAAFEAVEGYSAHERNPWYFPSVGEYATLLERHGFRTSYAVLFDRPTLLDNGERGLQEWLEMFAEPFLRDITGDRRQRLISHIEDQLRPTHFRDGIWFADYRRLRMVAIREEATP